MSGGRALPRASVHLLTQPPAPRTRLQVLLALSGSRVTSALLPVDEPPRPLRPSGAAMPPVVLPDPPLQPGAYSHIEGPVHLGLKHVHKAVRHGMSLRENMHRDRNGRRARQQAGEIRTSVAFRRPTTSCSQSTRASQAAPRPDTAPHRILSGREQQGQPRRAPVPRSISPPKTAPARRGFPARAPPGPQRTWAPAPHPGRQPSHQQEQVPRLASRDRG